MSDYRNAMRARGEQLLREAHDGVDPFRVAAFGAIRRAATIARHWDTISADTELDTAHGGTGWIETSQVSGEIRAAIRAAIGSAKA